MGFVDSISGELTLCHPQNNCEFQIDRFQSNPPQIDSFQLIPPTYCIDEHQWCYVWASIGECSNNPTYMTLNCQLSCSLCSP